MRATLLALLVLSALGSTRVEAQVIREPDRVAYSPRTTVNFSPTNLDGMPEKPGGIYITVKTKPGFASLIRVRGSFAPELEKSAEQL